MYSFAFILNPPKMGSSRQPERSLSSGISLPQWMKTKVDNRFDLDDTAFSPPSHDESFFYVRYAARAPEQPTTTHQGFRNIDQVLTDNNNATASTNQVASAQSVPKFKEVKDFSKHPKPCQPFVPGSASRSQISKPPKTIIAGKLKPKSQGTDDGFHGEPALCGKSIVHVANQIMSGQFSKNLPREDQDASGPLKKGSQSLPATPIASPLGSPDSSPKSRRRANANRYFTGAFVPDREKYQGGWLLSSLLGQSREIVVPKIEEEDESVFDQQTPRALSRKKSISSQNLTYIGKDKEEKVSTVSAVKSAIYSGTLKAKPSELREMNFWSPTSM